MTLLPEDLIQQAAGLLRSARNAVALTGAGISTPSGIPDFRSPGTGEWAHVNPMDVVSLSAFKHRPETFYAWLHPLAKKIQTAAPNPAHQALADLERLGILKAILTQNIDGLHQKAGSRNIIELHGALKTLGCPRCRKRYPGEEFFPDFVDKKVLPRCRDCQQILKPDIVFYEENLSWETLHAAENLSSRADVFLVAGTSLEVTPASGLPLYALENGASLIIITLSETYLDDQAEIIINHEISLALPAIVRAILKE